MSDRLGPQVKTMISGAETLLNFFRQAYRPDFRRGNSIHSATTGEMIPQVVACSSPNFAVIARLELATDAPRNSEGLVKRDSLPGFFKKWAPVAWGQLLSETPDEDEAALGADSLGGEEFRRLVRGCLLSEVLLADTIKGTRVTERESRSLIDWCVKFAKLGPWKSIRSKRCWCKLEAKPNGVILKVAIRVELFHQMRADKLLCSMGQNMLSRRAERYGVGASGHRDNRPEGLAAVILSDDFIADLTAGMANDPDPHPDTDFDPAELFQNPNNNPIPD